MSKVLITGITGQDGSYLAELLLGQGHQVAGLIRRHSDFETQTQKLGTIQKDIQLLYGDITDAASINAAIAQSLPDTIYNLAAQSDVKISFLNPTHTTATNALGVLNLLETVRTVNPAIRIYQASSSEQFGNSVDADGYQRETTPMLPVSPYGCSKLFAYNICKTYRDSYGMYVVNGILFNHESPRRGTNFLSNKVVKQAVKIYRGQASVLPLGNLESARDWGHARDYVKAMTLMMAADSPGDYICATGVTHSIRELVTYVFTKLGLDYQQYVTQDPAYYRETDIHHLRGDSTQLQQHTGWTQEYTFTAMLDEMIEYWLTQP